MNISIIICTYNRYRSLQRTLDSIRKMIVPDKIEWELIVVDNNSPDNTKKTVKSFQKSSPFLVRYVFEKKQGLSFARNRGIQEAKGELLAFTDDDVRVDRSWLKNIAPVFEKYDIACIGGKILPVWEKPKPDWLTTDLYGNLALLDYGESIIYLDKPKIWGANIVIKKSIFKKYGKFNTMLGRIPCKLFGFEETEFLETLIKNNEKVLYTPDILVYHYIPKSRIAKKYFRKWWFDNGELKAHLMGKYNFRKFLNTPYYIYIDTIKSLLEYLKAALFRHSDPFQKELVLFNYLGLISGRIKME